MSCRFGFSLGTGLGRDQVLQLEWASLLPTDWVSDSEETVSLEMERLADGGSAGGGGGGGSMLDVNDVVIRDDDII